MQSKYPAPCSVDAFEFDEDNPESKSLKSPDVWSVQLWKPVLAPRPNGEVPIWEFGLDADTLQTALRILGARGIILIGKPRLFGVQSHALNLSVAMQSLCIVT